MSNCSIKGCKTRKRAGDENVSFHRFPNSERYFSQWLKACGRGDWKPPSVHSRVCSRHFEKDLLIKSESVTFLVTGAVPTKFIHVQSGVQDEMTNLNKSPERIPDVIDISPSPSEIFHVCRICLRTDRKMFNLLQNNLNSVFEYVTNLKIGDDLGPKTLCWECAHRLSSCSKFIHLTRHTDSLLASLLADEIQLTSENVKKLKTNNIYTWELSEKSYSPNYIDLATVSHDNVEIEHTDTLTDLMQEDVEAETEVEIKEEMDEEPDDSLFRSYESEKSNSDEKIFTHRLKITSTNEKVKRKHRQPEELDPDTFATTSLSIEEQMKEIASRKESENYKNSPFKCDECYKGFLDESVYGSHMVRHSDECGSFICDVCKLHFHNRRALRHHHTSHMHRFSCKRCPFVTPRRYAAKLHNGYHNGIRYNCPKCSETFGKFSTYMSHLRIKHPSDYVCVLCGHSFVSDKGLALHRSLKHRFDQRKVTGDGPKCAECDINFVSDDALEQHYKVSSKHEDRRAAAPEVMQRKSVREELVKPLKRISRRRVKGPITCEQCDKQLPNSLAYHWHFRNSHPDKNRTNYPAMPYRCMCEVCGKMFQSLALLQDHSTCHAGAEQFECAQCGKRFARRYRLVAHRRLHGGRRATHACARCGRAFSTHSNLQRHAATHSALRPHKCDVCGKGFKHASLMNDHVKYVHLKTPWPKRRRAGRSGGKVTNQMGGGGDEAHTDWES